MEPRLLQAINKHNIKIPGVDFNKSLVELNENIITSIDALMSTGAGGNIFGVNKALSSKDIRYEDIRLL